MLGREAQEMMDEEDEAQLLEEAAVPSGRGASKGARGEKRGERGDRAGRSHVEAGSVGRNDRLPSAGLCGGVSSTEATSAWETFHFGMLDARPLCTVALKDEEAGCWQWGVPGAGELQCECAVPAGVHCKDWVALP